MSMVTMPKVVVKIDGANMEQDQALSLGDILIHEQLSLPTICEITFFNPVESLADASTMQPGTKLDISVNDALLFTGEVTAVNYRYESSGGSSIHVRAYDLLHRLRKRHPVTAHIELTLTELFSAMLGNIGMNIDAQEAGPLNKKLVQFRQSDLEFITEISERYGLYFTARNNTVKVTTLQGFSETIPLLLGSSLLEANIEINSHTACDSVTALGWNPWSSEQYAENVNQARSGRNISATVSAATVGGTGERIVVDQVIQDHSQAVAIAQAELDRNVANEVTLSAIADGNTKLQPGRRIELSGVAAPLSGQHVLTSVKHSINHNNAYISEIETAPPATQIKNKSTLTTLGIISQVNDPENLGRVRAVLPTYDDIETDWLDVVIPGAGANKGIIALPDVDDNVLILLINEDPAQSVVLGGLYGTQQLPDTGVEGGAIKRYTFVTPGGQRVKLDDQEQTVLLENSDGSTIEMHADEIKVAHKNGSYLELTANQYTMHSATKLILEAPGKDVTIAANSINFKRA